MRRETSAEAHENISMEYMRQCIPQALACLNNGVNRRRYGMASRATVIGNQLAYQRASAGDWPTPSRASTRREGDCL